MSRTKQLNLLDFLLDDDILEKNIEQFQNAKLLNFESFAFYYIVKQNIILPKTK